MILDSLEIFKCLADKSRLKIVGSLKKEPMYVELLAERIGISAPTVSFHLKKLMEAGLVSAIKEQYYTVYSLNQSLLTSSLGELIGDDEDDEELVREENYRNKVIESFFQYGKLLEIPVQKKKKQIIWEEIVKGFELSKEYSEKEVNIIIADIHEDFCTIRRDLVGFGLMERENGVYRRIK